MLPPGRSARDLNTPAPGRWLDLGRRGRTWIREQAGPEGSPTLLMLHGLGATGGLNWAGAHLFLADRFHMVTIDHRGHGRGIRTRAFRLEDCADDAAATIEALGIDRAILVGYSMGGPIAALLWQRHRHLVAGLVMCATSRNFRGSPGEKLAFGAMGVAGLSPVAVPQGVIRLCGAAVGAVPLPKPGPLRDLGWAMEEMGGHDPRSLVQAGAALGRFNASPWIGDVDVPTSVVVTANDQVVPPARQLRLARSIPAARVYRVDAGHFGVGGGGPKIRLLSGLRRACLDTAAGY